MEHSVTCGHCHIPLRIQGPQMVRYFLCEACQATTFYPVGAGQPQSRTELRSAVELCPMCGGDTHTAGASCSICGEPLPTELHALENELPQTVIARFTRVTHATIRWFQWGSVLFGTLFYLAGLYLLSAVATHWSDPTYPMMLAMLCVGLGTAVLFRSVGALGVAMLLLTGGSVVIFFLLVVLVVFLGAANSGITGNMAVAMGSALAVLILVNVVGWKIWRCGRDLQKAGFSPFISPTELPIGRRGTNGAIAPLQQSGLH